MKKFREVTKHMRKGIISFVLALSIVIQTLIVGLVAAPSAAAADETPTPGSSSAEVSSTYTDSGIAYITTKKLSYQGDRTFKLSLKATSSLREFHQTDRRTASEDGYFTASANGAGYYLLELYGGDGGEGAATNRGGQGVGGKGGYAYGYVYLNEGDTLVYTIGTMGDSLVHAGEDGSGENNEDAGHGDNGSYAVGAGGGYSAIYLVRADQQNADGTFGYQQPTEGYVTEAYRLNNYIMIAGGGGGGGAGNDALHPNTGNSNGGAGGTVAANSGIHVSSDENAINGGVAGHYFSGSDGDSSGNKLGWIDITSYDFVGVGGAFNPGQPKSTAFDIFDWRTTAKAQYWYEGGTGGSGNYRGGGGGAGFAGGGGGIMTGAAEASNVGGGGGGSSFIADSVKVFSIDDDSDIKSLLQGPGGNDNPSGTGGKAIITFIGADPDTKAFTEHLKDVTIEGEISEYFDILSVSVENGTANEPIIEGNKVTVTGADITPDDLGYEDEDNYCLVDILIKAKDEFFGGNRVPILAGLNTPHNGEGGPNFTLTTAEKDYETPDGIDNKHFDPMTFYFAGEMDGNDVGGEGDYLDYCDYCNVQLLMTAIGNSYSFSMSNIPDPFIELSDLYNDLYSDYRSNLSAHFESSYLAEITEYEVIDQSDSSKVTSLAKPTAPGKWTYTVGFYVTSKYNSENAAVVGPVLFDNTYISDTAVIIVLEAGSVPISGGEGSLLVDKLLSFENDQYHFQMSVKNSEAKNTLNIPYMEYHTDTSKNGPAEEPDVITEYNHLEVKISGWYAIGALGGKGGEGGGAYSNSRTGNHGEGYGGWGANGATISGFVYLSEGQTLTYYVGHDGADGAMDNQNTSDRNWANGYGGTGGTYSWVALDGELILIAAGGGGGGGAVARAGTLGNAGKTERNGGDATNGSTGEHSNANAASTSYTGDLADYLGGNGSRGNGKDETQRNAGSNPASYYNSSKVTLNSVSINGQTVNSRAYVNTSNGYNGYIPGVYISLVYDDEEGILIGTNAENSLDGLGRITNNGQPASATNGFYENLEFEVEFDRYFDLNSFDYNGNGAVTLTTDEVASGKSGNFMNGSVASPYSANASGNGVKVHFKPNDYDGKTYAFLTGDATSGYSLTLKPLPFELTYDFYLTPKEGFVGGNDVPLLKFDSSIRDDQSNGGVKYAGIGVKIPYDGVTRFVEEKNESDYANVAINYTFDINNFAAKPDYTIDCGTVLNGIEDLLESDENGPIDRFPAVADEDSWKWDYAKAYTARDVYARGDEKIDGSIFEKTTYTLKQSVESRIPEAQKAVVIGSVTPVEYDNQVTVTVVRPVEAELENATIAYKTDADGIYTETDGDEENPTVTSVKVATEADLSVTLTADKGYVLPEKKDDITVTVCGIKLTDFEYDSLTGELNIRSAAVRALLEANHAGATDHRIVIKATATPEKFELSFVWLDETGAEHDTFGDDFTAYVGKEANITGGNAKKFETGADLTNDDWFKQFLALDHIDLPDHKEFKWIWGTDDESPLTTMPGVNSKIPGYVTDKTYYVKVHYILEGDDTKTDLITPTEVFGAYGHFEVVTSPEIPGYVPVYASKLVTIEDDPNEPDGVVKHVYIEYIKAEGQLLVYHVKADTSEQIGEVDNFAITYDNIPSYALEVTVHNEVAHYTPKYDGVELNNGDTINIEITADDVANGKAVYIYYYPDQYKVTFAPNSPDDDVVFKATDKREKYVEYNNSFGYDAEEGKVIQFPQPERKGYTFLGWFTEPDGDEQKIVESVLITDETVDIAGITTYEPPKDSNEIILYAHWEETENTIIVNYTFLDKDGNEIEAGTTYWPEGFADPARDTVPCKYKEPYSIGIRNVAGFEFIDASRTDGIDVEYNADRTQITGTMMLSNIVYNVTYQQKTYTLTVNFAWEEGMWTDPTQAPELPGTLIIDNLVYGQDLSEKTRAVLEGDKAEALAKYSTYTGDHVTFTGLPASFKPDTDAPEITVYYTDTESVTISIHDFEFELSDFEYNTSTHKYDGKTLEKIDGNDYSINVDVQSHNDKTVDFTYESEDAYVDSLKGSFTTDQATVTGGTAQTVTTEFDLSLIGDSIELSSAEIKTGKFMSGKVIVTIGEEGVDEP